MKSLKTEDFFRLKYLSDVQTLKNKIFFVVAVANKKTNDYTSKIWMFDGKLREFTAGPKDSMPRISPDGKYLAFVSIRKEKKAQLLIMPLDGGEPKIIAEKEDISDILWSPDSKSIYFISNENLNKKTKSDIKIVERYPFYFNDKGFIFDKRPSLFNVTLNSKIKKLTSEPYNVLSFSVSSERDSIALIMREDDQDINWNNLYFLEKDKIRKIDIDGSFSNPKFSSSGNEIALVYSDNKKSVFQHQKLYIYNLKDESFKCITSEIDRNIENSINSDSRYGSGNLVEWMGNRVYFVVTDDGSSKLYYHDLGDNNHLYFENNESIDSFSVMDNGIAYISQNTNRPTELFIYKDKIKRITKFNKYFESLPKAKKYSFNASDGEKISFWFLSTDDRTKPTILEIHGGPKTAYGNAFMFEFQLLASSGFNVLFSNPRGSDGYSENFALKIKEHFGERDYEDIMELVEYAPKILPIDKEKMGVMGGSYGGFMTNWIVGHTDFFKVAITERSISNQISFFGTSDIGPGFNSDQIGKNPWELIQHYWDKSPIKYANNVKTPLLIIHSDEDYRCPIEQAYQLYTALKYFKKDVEMVIFPGENHELSRSGKPEHRIERFKLIINYMKKQLADTK